MGAFGCEYEGTISFFRRKMADSILRCVEKMFENTRVEPFSQLGFSEGRMLRLVIGGVGTLQPRERAGSFEPSAKVPGMFRLTPEISASSSKASIYSEPQCDFLAMWKLLLCVLYVSESTFLSICDLHLFSPGMV